MSLPKDRSDPVSAWLGWVGSAIISSGSNRHSFRRSCLVHLLAACLVNQALIIQYSDSGSTRENKAPSQAKLCVSHCPLPAVSRDPPQHHGGHRREPVQSESPFSYQLWGQLPDYLIYQEYWVQCLNRTAT